MPARGTAARQIFGTAWPVRGLSFELQRWRASSLVGRARSYDLITCVEGDANTFGTVYVGFSRSGWSYYAGLKEQDADVDICGGLCRHIFSHKWKAEMDGN
jgi:hypothetical protein